VARAEQSQAERRRRERRQGADGPVDADGRRCHGFRLQQQQPKTEQQQRADDEGAQSTRPC
jgi:hypothetical protein